MSLIFLRKCKLCSCISLHLLTIMNELKQKYSYAYLSQGIENFTSDLHILHPILTECRVLKSGLELELIQFANDISSEAHVEVNIFGLVPYDCFKF